ncbi:uncharacterized protein [Porites lutea]|uniref:uncharacterized protein isoform X2 n=1 Tax=Porites lutea TaxID=51062 RepID=UPI003CC6DBC8
MKPSLAFAFAFLASVRSNSDEVLLPIDSVQDGKLRQRLEKFIMDESPRKNDTAVGDEQGFEKSPADNPELYNDDMNYERFIEDELF